MCRFQKPSSASSLNPQQNTHSLAESAFMMIRQFISKGHIHPSRALSPSGPYSRVYAQTVPFESKQGHPSCQPVLPWVQTWYPQSTGLLGAELIWCKACLELHACIVHIFRMVLRKYPYIQIQLWGGAPDLGVPGAEGR